MVRHSFLCPNGTLFSQETLSCTAWHQVDCTTQGVEVLSGQWSLITTLTITSFLGSSNKEKGLVACRSLHQIIKSNQMCV